MLTLDELDVLVDAGLIDSALMLQYPVSTALKAILKNNGCEINNDGDIVGVPDIQILYSKLYNNGFVDLYFFESDPDEDMYQEELTIKINEFISNFIDGFNGNGYYKNDYTSNPEQLPSNRFELLIFTHGNYIFKYDRYDTGELKKVFKVNGTINCMDYGHSAGSYFGLNYLFGGEFTEVTRLSDNSVYTVNNVFMVDFNYGEDSYPVNTFNGSTGISNPINFVSVLNFPVVYFNKTNGYDILKWNGSDWNGLDSTSSGHIYSVINNENVALIHRQQLSSASGLLVYNETNFQEFTFPEVTSGDNRLADNHQNINSIIPVIGNNNRYIINFNGNISSYGLTNYSSTNHNVITIEIDTNTLTAETIETKIVTTTEQIIFAYDYENLVYYVNPSSKINGYGYGVHLCENFFDTAEEVFNEPLYLIKNGSIKFLSDKLIVNNNESGGEISTYDNYHMFTYENSALPNGVFYENRMPLKTNIVRSLTDILSEKKGTNSYIINSVDYIGRWLIQNNWNN